LLAPLRALLKELVTIVAEHSEQTPTDLLLFGRKIDVLKAVELVIQSIDHPGLLGSVISEHYVDELLFVVLSYANCEYRAAEKYPIEVVRSELFEVLEAYLRVLKKLLQRVTQGSTE